MVGVTRAAVVAAAACALAAAGAAAAQSRANFTEADNGRAVRLYSPVFTVDLPRSTGTGYHWEFGSRNSRGVELVSKGGGRAPPHAPGIVGYPATDRFTLRATGADGELRIGLLAPGRYDGPERVFRLTFRSAYGGRQDRDPYSDRGGDGSRRGDGYYAPQRDRGDYGQPQPRPYGYPPG